MKNVSTIHILGLITVCSIIAHYGIETVFFLWFCYGMYRVASAD